jgi:hypothetical protein
MLTCSETPIDSSDPSCPVVEVVVVGSVVTVVGRAELVRVVVEGGVCGKPPWLGSEQAAARRTIATRVVVRVMSEYQEMRVRFRTQPEVKEI